MVGDTDRKSVGGNVILKFDMAKAYDRLEWRFLLRALRATGFSEMVQDMVYRSICDIHYKINVNGECSTEFRSSRGVRQGDPLSPLRFIVAQQIFAFDLKRKVQLGEIKPYKLGRNTPAVSHLFFADDMLLFVNGRVRSLRNLRNLLQKYETFSGQQINLTKSSLFISKRIHGHKLEKVQQVMGCTVKSFPFTYLGAPLYRGRYKAEYFDRIIQLVTNRLEGWKNRFISFAGKIILLKSVLASIPIHTLSCMAVPKSVIQRLENLMKHFLWSQQGQKQIH